MLVAPPFSLTAPQQLEEMGVQGEALYNLL